MKTRLVIHKLNIRQIITVYRASLRHEFPLNERRPLLLILKGVLAGTYECLGAFYNGKIVGYAFFLKCEGDYLWDYLAVAPKWRCKGVGTDMLRLITAYYQSVDSVIGEVENPAFAETQQEREHMARRLDFYLRNGCVDTGVRTETFGAHFIIIRIAGWEMTVPELEALYQKHYRVSMPRRIYEGNVRIER